MRAMLPTPVRHEDAPQVRRVEMQDKESLVRTRDILADELRSLMLAMPHKKDREVIREIAREYDAMAAAMASLHRE